MATRHFMHERIRVAVSDSASESAGQAAADFAAAAGELLAERGELNAVFAGAQSQMEFHRALVARRDIDWQRINAFGVDEFWAPDIPRELSVSDQPRRDLYSRVRLKTVHILDHAAADPEAERARYEHLIAANRPDIACLGIGVSGHLAFNEPGDMDFDDPRLVRVMEVCQESKRQLMSDPNFAALGRIPGRGITMTIPALMSARTILCVAPYAIKAATVRRFFLSPVTAELPATILKRHAGARLYLDLESFGRSAEFAAAK